MVWVVILTKPNAMCKSNVYVYGCDQNPIQYHSQKDNTRKLNIPTLKAIETVSNSMVQIYCHTVLQLVSIAFVDYMITESAAVLNS